MEYGVFTAEPLLVHSGGFPLFGKAHLLWLAACLIVICLVRWAYRHALHAASAGAAGHAPVAASPYPGSSVLRVAAFLALAFLASDDILMASQGVFTRVWWPLHFCNFAEYLCLIYAIHPNKPCRELLLTLGLPGGLAAMLFPGWTECPPYTWPVICGFMEHALIFSVSLCAVDSSQDVPRPRDSWISFAFVAAYTLFFRWFNARMGTNFGFVSAPAYGSPLEQWYDALGDPGYLVPYAAAFVVVCLVLHLWMERRRRSMEGPAKRGGGGAS